MAQNQVSIKEVVQVQKGLAYAPCHYIYTYPTIKTEAQPQEAAKQLEEKCGWGPNCPLVKIWSNTKEDWDDNTQYPQQNVPLTQSQYHPNSQGQQQLQLMFLPYICGKCYIH